MYLHRFNRTIRTKNNLEFPQIMASIVSDNVVAAKSAGNKKVHLIAEGVCRGRSVERRLGGEVLFPARPFVSSPHLQ